MRVAEGKLEGRALERGAVADADELELLLEALLDAFDHVVDERTGETVEALGLAGVIRTRTIISSPSRAMVIIGLKLRVSSPFGPFTVKL